MSEGGTHPNPPCEGGEILLRAEIRIIVYNVKSRGAGPGDGAAPLVIKGGMKTENGKLSTPSASLVAPVSGGQLAGMRGERMSGEWFIHPLRFARPPVSGGQFRE